MASFSGRHLHSGSRELPRRGAGGGMGRGAHAPREKKKWFSVLKLPVFCGSPIKNALGGLREAQLLNLHPFPVLALCRARHIRNCPWEAKSGRKMFFLCILRLTRTVTAQLLWRRLGEREQHRLRNSLVTKFLCITTRNKRHFKYYVESTDLCLPQLLNGGILVVLEELWGKLWGNSVLSSKQFVLR